MVNSYFFGSFANKSKKNNCEIVSNIYADKDFTEFYHMSMDNANDIEFYQEHFNKNDKILEIGTGDGRVFTPLATRDFDIYGIEPEEEMIKYIPSVYQQKVKTVGIEEISKVNWPQLFSVIMIPATTVSLFEKEVFLNFLSDAKKLLSSKGRVIFDFVSPNHLVEQNKKVNIYKLNGATYFYGNMLHGDHFILNIYFKKGNIEKLGYSIKNVYSLEMLKSYGKMFGYDVKVLADKFGCLFVEMILNE